MKANPLLLLPVALLLAVSGQAQTAHPLDPTEQTREMSAHLKLNEGQFVRLLTLNRTRLLRQHEIEHSTKSDAPERASQLAELQAQYELECGRILSPSQLSQLQQDESQPPTSGGAG